MGEATPAGSAAASGDAVELEVRIALPLPKEFGIALLGDEQGQGGMSIVAGVRPLPWGSSGHDKARAL